MEKPGSCWIEAPPKIGTCDNLSQCYIERMRHTTAAEIDKALRAHYKGNGFVVLSEVRNGTGVNRSPRSADMFVISTWPSRGLYAAGIEIKVSKSDLKKELATPEKAEALAKYCSYWYIAVPDDMNLEDVIVPVSWGVITVNDKGKVHFLKPGEVMKPEPPDMLMVCSMLRNFAESHVHVSEIKGQIEAGRQAALKEAEDQRPIRHKDLEAGYEKLKEVSGIDLLNRFGHPVWQMGNIADAINMLISLRDQPAEELERIASTLDAAKASVLTVGKAMYPKRFAGKEKPVRWDSESSTKT